MGSECFGYWRIILEEEKIVIEGIVVILTEHTFHFIFKFLIIFLTIIMYEIEIIPIMNTHMLCHFVPIRKGRNMPANRANSSCVVYGLLAIIKSIGFTAIAGGIGVGRLEIPRTCDIRAVAERDWTSVTEMCSAQVALHPHLIANVYSIVAVAVSIHHSTRVVIITVFTAILMVAMGERKKRK